MEAEIAEFFASEPDWHDFTARWKRRNGLVFWTGTTSQLA